MKATWTVIILTVLFVGAATAQLDPTFGTGGVVTTDLSGADTPVAVFVRPDSKILVVARKESLTPPAQTDYYFIRYNSDGTPDNTFGSGGKMLLPIASPSGVNNIVKAVMQPDGKVILAGSNSNNGLIVRLNSDGSLDSGFANGGVHRPNINQIGSDGIADVALLADGKILVGGFAQMFSFPSLYLLRYNSNGTLDQSFGTEGYITHLNLSAPTSIFVQSTGKILAVAPVDYGTPTSGSVRRFNSDGSVDNSFTTVLFPYGAFAKAEIQPDDKVLIASFVTSSDSLDRQHSDIKLTRFAANGTLDSAFGGGGGQAIIDITNYFENFTTGLKVLANGDILVIARTDVQPNRSALKGPMLSVAKLSSAGAITGRLLVTNSLGYNYAEVAVQPDGKIVLVDYISPGGNSDSDVLVARITGVPLTNYKFRGVPFDFRYPAFNGVAEPSIFRPSDRRWYLYNTYPGYFFGLSEDIPVPSDYIQDLSTDMAMFRPTNGTWYIARDYQNAASLYIDIQWGANGDIPSPGDFDGDGKSDLAVFRPSNGVWYTRNSFDGSYRIVQWGVNGDKPAAGDFDGDTIDDLAVFRPSDGNWYILKSSDGLPIILHFGLSGDIPVQEDYDGDGKSDIAVFRPSDGVWYRLNSSDGSFFAFQWGISSDIAVPADYDGDRKSDIAVWRQANGRWYVYQSSTNSMLIYSWGTGGDIPLPRR